MRVLVMGRSGVEYDDEHERVSFDTLLEQSDFVSLHGLLTAQTEKMMNRDAFQKMKSGSFLINTARGGLVDEDHFAMRLSQGI